MVFTAPRGQNVIEGNDNDESCVLIRQGAHHVIVRGLVLKNCKRYGVLIQRQGGDTPSDAQTHDIVIEDNEITGWGGFENLRKDRAWPTTTARSTAPTTARPTMRGGPTASSSRATASATRATARTPGGRRRTATSIRTGRWGWRSIAAAATT